jgi:drug/metabolite transporter (DMT)-like permease
MTGATAHQADRPMSGIVLQVGFCVLAPMGDGLAKYLGADVPLLVLILARFAIQALILLPFVLWVGGRLWPGQRLFGLTMLRTALHIVGIGAMFLSLRFLPLADALAIAFVCPFLLLILGHYVLGEHVGPHRMWACAAGFGGVLLVIQPNFLAVGLPALLPLVVALAFALFMLVTRHIAKEVDPVTLQTISGLQATVVLLPLVLILADLPAFVAGAGETLWLLGLLGVIGTAAHLLMTWSLRFAPTATLAPMQYLEIPFATLIGWLLFQELPNGMAAAGILLTVSAGLYIILRERAIAARPVPSAQ